MELLNPIYDAALWRDVSQKINSPCRYLARFSQFENLDEPDMPRIALFFEAYEAEWFERQPVMKPEARSEFFRVARLSLLELRISDSRAVELFPQRSIGTESEWYQLILGPTSDQEDQPIYTYTNLFQPEAPRRALISAELVGGELARQLEASVSLADLPDASESELAGALEPLSQIAFSHAVAYDVGQGNALGFIDRCGIVQGYFDLGGGTGRHAFTFPSALKSFCFSARPPIILSHWDHDHWSSTGRTPAAFARTWIAPRQQIGPVQAACAAQILRSGRLLLIGNSFQPMRFGCGMIERANGSGRNDSGLVLTWFENSGSDGRRMLFPADARYEVISSVSQGGTYHSLVATHHGAKLWKKVPASSGAPSSRVVYSYGERNQYGHATREARDAHMISGWIQIRNTPDRDVSGLGHVLLSWEPLTGLVPSPCAGQHCQLSPVQI